MGVQTLRDLEDSFWNYSGFSVDARDSSPVSALLIFFLDTGLDCHGGPIARQPARWFVRRLWMHSQRAAMSVAWTDIDVSLFHKLPYLSVEF